MNNKENTEVCVVCNGTGYVNESTSNNSEMFLKECWSCRGLGYVYLGTYLANGKKYIK